MKTNNKFLGAGAITAVATSLCCITPVIALITGTSSLATRFSWIEPLRPYLIGVTVFLLLYAWYAKFTPINKENCDCDPMEKPSFFQGKPFLIIVTLFSILMMSFPFYSFIFYGKEKQKVEINRHSKTIELSISGMTCDACTQHVDHSVNKLKGIYKIETSYENANAIIVFDSSQTNSVEITEAINTTGYTVVNRKTMNSITSSDEK